MSYVLYGFLFGFVIPYMARRFAKFMPTSAANAVWRLICPVKYTSFQKRKGNNHYKKLIRSYFWRSFMYGLAGAVLFYLASLHFESFGLGGVLAFMWALLLLFEIDYKTMFLPDVVTVPLLIGGFVFSTLCGVWVLPVESALGATTGYVLPLIAGLMIVWKHADAFGGGDIKLLAAVGAWLGILPVIYTILLSTLLFGAFALIRHRREGAFGPAISVAAIILAFYFF